MAPNLIAGLIEQQERQKLPNAAITVHEGMDTLEVEHKGSDQQQRIDVFIRQRVVELLDYLVHEFRCRQGRDRLEAHDLSPVRLHLQHYAILGFPLTAALFRVVIQSAVSAFDQVGVSRGV